MELASAVLLLVLLTCLAALLRRRSSTRRRGRATSTSLHQIGDPAVAHRALVQNAAAFSDRPVALFPAALANGPRGERYDNLNSVAYGAHWRALRCNLTAETLHPSRLGHLEPLQREAVQALVAAFSADGDPVVTVREHIYAVLFLMATRLCFGDGVDGRHVRDMQLTLQGFKLAVTDVSALPTSPLGKLFHWRRWLRLIAYRGRQSELFLPLIAARRRACISGTGTGGRVRRPYVDTLIQLRVPDGNRGGGRRALTDNDMMSLVSEFLGATTGTVASCLEWTLAHLVAQPEVQEKLYREVVNGGGDITEKSQLRSMPYLHAVVLESLRLHPPVPFALRQVRADDAAAGVLLLGESETAGIDLIHVQFTVGGIGRDRKTWTDPHEFRPERFLPGGEGEDVGPLPGPKELRMMPFGAGHRLCPGMGMAMANIKYFLAALVREFQWAPPVNDAAVDLTELDAFFKVMNKPLSARVTPRN